MKRIVILCTLLAVACGGKRIEKPAQPKPTIQPADEQQHQIDLREGWTTELESSGIRLKFLNVESDTRCPANVVCAQAGSVVARFRYEYRGESSEFTLESEKGCFWRDCGHITVLGEPDPVTEQVYYRFTLLRVEPEPREPDFRTPENPNERTAVLLAEMGLWKMEFFR